MMLKEIFRADTRYYKRFIYLADFKAKHLFKVCRLANEEQIKSPAPAEVCHDNCIDRHGGEELPPGGLIFLCKQTENQLDVQHLHVVLQIKAYRLRTHFHCAHQLCTFTDALLDVTALLLSDGRVLCWTLVGHQDPEHVPKYPKAS